MWCGSTDKMTKNSEVLNSSELTAINNIMCTLSYSIYRGYYIAVRRYVFYLRVVKQLIVF